jgi:hypothetical protein
MNPLTQFLAATSGGILGILIVSLFVKRNRARFFLWCLCMAPAIGLTIPIYKATLDKWRYGIWPLPVLGGILASAGLLVGHVVVMARAKRADRKT